MLPAAVTVDFDCDRSNHRTVTVATDRRPRRALTVPVAGPWPGAARRAPPAGAVDRGGRCQPASASE